MTEWIGVAITIAANMVFVAYKAGQTTAALASVEQRLARLEERVEKRKP